MREKLRDDDGPQHTRSQRRTERRGSSLDPAFVFPTLTRLQSHVATFMDEGMSSTIAATSVSNKTEEAEREMAAPLNGRKMPLDV